MTEACSRAIVAVDAAKLEERMLAHVTDTQPKGWDDPHTQRAAKIFKVGTERVTPLMRKVGKQANYIDAYR